MALSPLFDIYDRGGTVRSGLFSGMQYDEDDPYAPPGSRRPQISDLMPEEEQRTMMRRLSEMGTSGLSGLGWILDTPGAVVRGALSGGLGKGLSALWDTSDERITGRELLRQYGMVGDEDNWANFTGGLAAEMLLDPTTYLSLGLNQILGKGAKTLGGGIAQKAGLLDDFDVYARNTLGGGTQAAERQALRQNTTRTIIDAMPTQELRDDAMRRFQDAAAGRNVDELIDQPLARMNSIHIPFTDATATDLFGQRFGDWAARAGDQLGEGIMTNPYTGRAARELQRAFDPSVLGFVDRDRQWDAKEIMANRRVRESQDRATLAGLQEAAGNALRANGGSLNDQGFSQAMRNFLETGNVDEAHFANLNLPEVQQLTTYFDNYRQNALTQSRELGLPLNEFQSRAGINFFPRQQTRFDTPRNPEWPAGVTPPERLRREQSRGQNPIAFDDNYSRGRRVYTDVMGGSNILNRLSRDGALQNTLRASDNVNAREALEMWTTTNNLPDLYGWMDELDADGAFVHAAPALPDSHPLRRQLTELQGQLDAAIASNDGAAVSRLNPQIAAIEQAIPDEARQAWRSGMHTQLADLLRSLDPQHAQTGVPLFGQNSFNEMARYVLGRGRVESNADAIYPILQRNMEATPADSVIGGVNYTPEQALAQLGLTGPTAREVLEQRMGTPLDGVSFNKRFIDDWARAVNPGRMPPELSGIAKHYDDFTKSFKTLALLWPSRYSRDAYSGQFAAAMKNAWNPADWWRGTQVGQGDYNTRGLFGMLDSPAQRVAQSPRYRGLPQDEAMRQFLVDAGGQGLGGGQVAGDVATGAGVASLREMYPGAAAADNPTLMDRARQASIGDWAWPFSVRNASGNRNPILEAGDRAAEWTDSGNRYGTYMNLIHQGVAPNEAKRLTDLTQVNYNPDAFTEFERNILRKVFPFYSYTRGIAPLVADSVINQPQGLMGQSIRAITRASQPTEDNFTPEYLRQSASIPVVEGLPFFGLSGDSGLKRYLTNIDLPFESLVNLITPGVGNNLFDQVGSTLHKSALNILGQTNPLIKGPLELATNRQFFSGRQLSDLYSMLEQPLGSPGRVLEQAVSNAPGGSRLLGTIRQLADDRLSPTEKYSKFLVNALTGLKFQDVDQERTQRLAARDMMNQLLETTPGVRTYENLTVDDEALRGMPKQQQDMYLLYKIIQTEAAKRARQRKAAEAGALLGYAQA